MHWYRKAFIGFLCFGVGSLQAATLPSEDLKNPAAEHIPLEVLNEAAATAVTNGLLSFLEVMHHPDNPNGYPYPPIAQLKVIRYEEGPEVRYRKVKRQRPVYKTIYKDVQRMVPKRDEYGNITGYEKRTVKVAVDKVKTGKTSTYTVEVQDPNGPIVKRHRKAIYGAGGAAHIPNGWWAINGMALYAFAKAGLGDLRKVEFAAMMLENLARREGVPDRTQDLA